MQTGISTASLFVRYTTEDAVKFLQQNNITVCEIFLSTYSEYSKKFGKLLKKNKGDMSVNSVHVLNTQFEPQLFSINDRARDDAYLMLDSAMSCAKEVGAKYYTFHGVARVKKTPIKIDYDRVGTLTQEIIDRIKKYGVTLAFENVHWSYYNYIGFFNEIRKRTEGLKGTIDIKQARQSGIDYSEYIKEMGSDIVTVHLSDVKEDGKMCLPGKGITDFDDLFMKLKDVGFDGTALIEVYQSDYKEERELFESLDFINEKAYKYFK